jgi:hypothetical protein
VRPKFLHEYHQAALAAYEPAHYGELRDLLTEWAILATAYSRPDFQQRFRDVRAGVGEYVPMSEVFPHRTA